MAPAVVLYGRGEITHEKFELNPRSYGIREIDYAIAKGG